MYPITNDTLQRFQNGNMQYIRITIGSTVIDGSKIMQGSCSINRYVQTNESVAIGSTVAAEMVLTLNNYNGEFDNTDFVGNEAYVEIGVKDANNTIQYVPMGYFIIDEADKAKNTISLAALDRMVKFDKAVDSSQLSFPYTLTNLLSRICTLCSVTKGTFTLTNSSYSVSALPSETKTYRDLLRWICELSGSNAYISYDGKLYLAWYGTTSQFTTTTANRTASEIDKNTFTITGVTILTGDNQKYTAGTNVRPITINNNPFITTTQAQSVATTLNTKLGGFSYCPFTATLLPSPQLFPMDRGTFTTADGTDVAVSITEVTYKLNGNTDVGCKGEMAVRGRTYGLGDQTFYASNIAAGAITADKISAGAVTTDALAANAVTVGKIDPSVDMATNAGVATTYATKAAAAGSTQRIYYRTSSSTAPTAPSSWVTSTSTANNTWSTKRMQYDQTYKYLWTCIQTKTVSGSVSNSTVLLDDTTTVIDGGNIITASISANKVDVSDLNAFEATIANWEIGDTAITKSRTVSNVTYSAGMYAPTNLTGDSEAIKVQAGTTVTALQYDGTLESKSGDTSGYYTRLTIDGTQYETEQEYYDAVQTQTDRYGHAYLVGSDLFLENSKRAHGTSTSSRPAYEAEIAAMEHRALMALNAHTGTNTESGIYAYTDGTNNEISIWKGSAASVFGLNQLTINNQDLLRLDPHLSQVFSTTIPANADLNTLTYLVVGQYVCNQNTTVGTLTNCPTNRAFTMTVEAPIAATIDNESSTSVGRYRLRKIFTYNAEVYCQFANAAQGSSTWTYSDWVRFTDDSRALLLTGGTLTGGLTVNNSDIKISPASANRVIQIETTSGIRTSLYVNTSVNQGIYSNGYGTSLTDSSAVNVASADGLWIIRRGSNGSVYIPEWGGIGSTGNPIYIDSNGKPSAMDGSDIMNGLTTDTAASQRDDYIITQFAGGGTTTTTYHRRALKNVFKALNSSDVTTALGYTPSQTDENVTQTQSSANGRYRLLMSGSADDTTKTEGAKKNYGISANPSMGRMYVSRDHSSATTAEGSIVIGTQVGNGTAGACHGSLYVYGKGTNYGRFWDKNGLLTQNQEYELPNASGVLALEPTLTTGSGTRNTTNSSAGTASYTKYGRVVCVSIYNLTIKSTAADNATVFTGLPTASSTFITSLPCVQLSTSSPPADNCGVPLYVDTSGNLKISDKLHDSPTGKIFAGSFTYISAS